MELSFRVVIYKSMRSDWGLAVIDQELHTAVLLYEKTQREAQRVAGKLFNQVLTWKRRIGLSTHETDHPGVSFNESVTWIESTVMLKR
jgi:hypothetical protein